MSAIAAMSSVFELPPESSVQMNVRVPKSLQADLKRVVELWNQHAAEQGVKTEIDLAHVVRTLLRRQVQEELQHFDTSKT